MSWDDYEAAAAAQAEAEYWQAEEDRRYEEGVAALLAEREADDDRRWREERDR